MEKAVVRANAVSALIAAALMLYLGWMMGGWVYPDDAGVIYVKSLDIFDWMLRLGGIGMAIVAVLCFAGVRAGLLMEFIVSGVCGAIMAGCGVIWVFGAGIGLTAMLALLSGIILLGAALRAGRAYRATQAPAIGTREGAPRPGEHPAATGAVNPPHPASVASPVMPKAGEPQPEGGYLAALSKEKDDDFR